MKLDTGARSLRNVIEDFMLELMYELPEADAKGQRYVVTEKMIASGQKPTLRAALARKKESA